MKTEFAWLSSQLFIWHRYDSSVKAELFSTALGTPEGAAVIDPIETENADGIESLGSLVAVLITNANHARAAQTFADRYGARSFAPEELRETFPNAQSLADGQSVYGLDVLSIEGAAPGEFAFYDHRDGGTIVVGDALINFGSDGFSLLPRKYCVDQKQMRRSLRKLLALDFKRILFAHGEPIVVNAHQRLSALLKNE